MRGKLTSLGRFVLDFVFPPVCFGCGSSEAYICSACIESLPRLEPPFCSICAEPLSSGDLCQRCRDTRLAVDRIIAPFKYEGTIRRAVLDLKFKNVRASAPDLAGLVSDFLADRPGGGQFLVPVPLHKGRLRDRGYNQSALLAKEVSRLTGIPVMDALVVRAIDTQPQTALSWEERLTNVAQAFRAVKDLSGMKITLIDDVATTGSTLSACAQALKEAGAVYVDGVVLAR